MTCGLWIAAADNGSGVLLQTCAQPDYNFRLFII